MLIKENMSLYGRKLKSLAVTVNQVGSGQLATPSQQNGSYRPGNQSRQIVVTKEVASLFKLLKIYQVLVGCNPNATAILRGISTSMFGCLPIQKLEAVKLHPFNSRYTGLSLSLRHSS